MTNPPIDQFEQDVLSNHTQFILFKNLVKINKPQIPRRYEHNYKKKNVNTSKSKFSNLINDLIISSRLSENKEDIFLN